MVAAERGQALTLEAVTAGILLLLAVGFALQMTAVTPLSASTSSQHLENQLEASGQGALAGTAETGSLKAAVLYWNETESEFQGTNSAQYYRAGDPDNDFGDTLQRAFGNRSIAYNVVVHYQSPGGGMESQRMVYQGDPSDHAVSASRTVTLLDSDNLTAGDDRPELRHSDSFYVPDVAPGRSLYNLVRVEVVAWRI